MVRKYQAVLNLITVIENRLLTVELFFITMNTGILFFILWYESSLPGFDRGGSSSVLRLFSVMLCIVVGEAICVYWVIVAMRLQLKLKLRYFQARSLERKMDSPDEFFISDESLFFNPTHGIVRSSDGREEVVYPNAGALRMDGFAGSAKPRHLSWIFPALFFFLYCISLITMLLKHITS
ncbi:MAG: hypothetical protein HQK89_10900 [Nitrospirae bacterium]|nr:hypothetical protein [Nitrospirota bacterium]